MQRLQVEDRGGLSVASLAGSGRVGQGDALDPDRCRSLEVRGLVGVLVVLHHVAGGEPGDGLGLPRSHWLNHLVLSYDFVKMPIFAFLSGLIYARRPVGPGGWRPFMAKKALRLLLPFALTALLLAMAGTAFKPESSGALLAAPWRIWLFPLVHLWFLQALVLIFAIVAALDALGALRDRWGFGLLFACAMGLQVAHAALSEFFSLARAAHIFTPFLAGVAVVRFRDALSRRELLWASGLVLLACLALRQAELLHLEEDVLPWREVLGPLGGIAAAYLLLSLMPGSALLAAIGRHGFTIYLFHLFVVAVAVRAVEAIGGIETGPTALLATAAGVAAPFLLGWWARPGPRLLATAVGAKA